MTNHDNEAIRRVIAQQFNGLCWTPDDSADWKMFAADLLRGLRIAGLFDQHTLGVAVCRSRVERTVLRKRRCARSLRLHWARWYMFSAMSYRGCWLRNNCERNKVSRGVE